MSTIDTLTIHEEFERIESELNRLSSENKMTDEVQALVTSMTLMMKLLISIFLERSTKKTSKNSSIPSSQTAKDETAIDSKSEKQGKGKDLSGQISNQRTIENVTRSEVSSCQQCGADLSSEPSKHLERRTKIDIIFEKVVEHVDAEVKCCPNCKHTNKGTFPKDMPSSRQYGNGVKAFCAHLLVGQMVSLKRTQKQFEAMFGETISEATLLNHLWTLHQALEPWEDNVIQSLLKKRTLHVDETSLRVDKKNHWIHVYSSEGITLKRLHSKRGKQAIEDINIIPQYQGVIVHDCWASYLSYAHVGHGLCGSHLLRDLTFVIDSNGYKWARNMKKLLLKTCRTVGESQNKCLDEQGYANLQKHYRNLLTRASKELPEIPPKSNGRRGKMAKSDAHNLYERLKKYETAVLLFAKDPNVAFTNNRAERDLRMAKVKQKVSGCFRSQQYAQAYCRISSYLQTMAYQGINPFVAIQNALNGQFFSPQISG